MKTRRLCFLMILTVSVVFVSISQADELSVQVRTGKLRGRPSFRSEEHTSELQSHSFISYAVFCLKKKKDHM